MFGFTFNWKKAIIGAIGFTVTTLVGAGAKKILEDSVTKKNENDEETTVNENDISTTEETSDSTETIEKG